MPTAPCRGRTGPQGPAGATVPPATAIPLVEAGTGAVGVATKYAREDHVHPLGPGGGGGASVLVSDTPPVGAADNSLWFESDTGMLYIRYNDGNSSQWVMIPGGPSDAVRYGAQTLTATEQTQARKNIYAAPFDAMAYNGMQINGSMDVSQEISRGTWQTVQFKYACDGWMIYVNGSGVAVQGTSGALAGVPGLGIFLQFYTTAIKTSLVAADAAFVSQTIEGVRVSRLGWGTASASPVTIGFWSSNTLAGLYSGSIRNGASDRSYVFTYTQAVASTAQYNVITIPGDTSGTWATDSTGGMILTFTLADGGTRTTSSINTWIGGNYNSATGQVNSFNTASNAIRLTGVVVLPGSEAPTAARSALIMRPYDQELLTCQRYFRSYGGENAYEPICSGQVIVTTQALGLMYWDPVMRATPAIAGSGAFLVYTASGGVAPLTSGITANVMTKKSAVLVLNVASGLVPGSATALLTNNDINARFKLDARL